ncbi:MAG: hypothetical protein ABIO70_26745 [Pseudomonadota bacterium]
MPTPALPPRLRQRLLYAARIALPAPVLLWCLQYLHVMPAFSDMDLPYSLRVWWPLVFTLGAAAAAGMVGAGVAWWRFEQGCPVPAKPWSRPPLGWPDLATGLGLLALSAGVVAHFAHATNPEGTLVGVDAPSYLNNMLVILRSDWQWYNGDKRILHGLLGAFLGWLLGGDIQRAALWISAASVALMGPLTWLAGRAAFGRLVPLLAALVVIFDAQVFSYAIQTTNYALYYVLVAALLAASAWAVARPGGWRLPLVGLAAALLWSTQEKAPLIVGPCALLVTIATLWVRPRRWGLSLGIAVVAGALTVFAMDPPVPYTPFGSLIVNQREELHNEMPGWTWDDVKQPDPARPCPLSPWLPESLQRSGLEATLAGLMAPPDSDVLRLVQPGPSDPAVWAVDPDTSIPPWSYRVAFNHRALSITFGGRLPVQLSFIALGLLAALVPWPRRHGREQLLLILCLGILPSLLGPLSLKYHPRYFFHALPALALLSVGGTAWVLQVLAGPRRVPALLAQVLLVPVALAWALTVYQGDTAAWRRPVRALALAPMEQRPADLGVDGFPLALARAAHYLAESPATQVHDCGPVPLGLLLGGDPRAEAHPQQACRELLSQPATPGALLISSDRPEYRAPDTLTMAQIRRSGAWRIVRVFDPWNLDQELPKRISPDAVVFWSPT